MVLVGRKNVLLLTVDALRRDHLGCYDYHRNTSPVIDRLAAASIRFDNAYSASCHTREAVPALITGKYPDEAVHRYYRLRYPPIAEYLHDAGYRTGAFLTAPFLTAANHYDHGFQTFQTSYRYTDWNLPHFLEYFWEIAANTHYASGEWVNDQLTAFIRSGDEQPFFAWGTTPTFTHRTTGTPAPISASHDRHAGSSTSSVVPSTGRTASQTGNGRR